jgi:energy-coupling factor transport system substrate-specific component
MTTTTASYDRDRLWEVTSRTIVYAAVGAALYAVLGLISIPVPGFQNVAIRPAYALVPFFGYAFGPIVGFFTGFVGNVVIDQISGYGALTAWNWSLANGLAGLLAGLLPALVLTRGGIPEGRTGDLIRVGLIAAAATVIGFLFVLTDVFVFSQTLNLAIAGYIQVVLTNLIPALILTPLLVAAWRPLREQLGR